MNRTRLWTLVFIVALIALAAGIAIAKDPARDPRLVLTDEGSEYIGTPQCIMCHSDKKDSFLGTKHALTLGNPKLPASVVGCEMCHGPGSEHMSNFTNEHGQRKINAFTGDVIDDFGGVGQQFADPGPAVPVLREFEQRRRTRE